MSERRWKLLFNLRTMGLPIFYLLQKPSIPWEVHKSLPSFFSSKMVWEKETRVTASSSFGSRVLVFRFECCYCITPPPQFPSFPKQTTIEDAHCRAVLFFARKLFQFLLAYHDFPHSGLSFLLCSLTDYPIHLFAVQVSINAPRPSHDTRAPAQRAVKNTSSRSWRSIPFLYRKNKNKLVLPVATATVYRKVLV